MDLKIINHYVALCIIIPTHIHAQSRYLNVHMLYVRMYVHTYVHFVECTIYPVRSMYRFLFIKLGIIIRISFYELGIQGFEWVLEIDSTIQNSSTKEKKSGFKNLNETSLRFHDHSFVYESSNYFVDYYNYVELEGLLFHFISLGNIFLVPQGLTIPKDFFFQQRNETHREEKYRAPNVWFGSPVSLGVY